MKPIVIGKKRISRDDPVFCVAEMSANHHQNFDEAVRLIQAAKESGADAIKLQTYTADTITLKSQKDYFKVQGGTLWEGRNLHQLYEEAHTPWEWQPKLKKVANDLGLELFSSPFDFTAVDFLEQMNVPAYKVASFEVVDIPLIKKMAQTGKPMIMSTGMASLDEINEAVAAIRSTGNDQIVLLKCTSAYPAPPEEMNLLTLPDMAKRFGVPVGLSDHTLGVVTPIVAVGLGMVMIEKHLTLSRNTPGPDSAFSLEPHEFKALVDSLRVAQKTLGQVCYDLTEKQKLSLPFRRSLFVVKSVQQGEIFTADHVKSIRPAHGLAPKYYDQVLGKRALCSIEEGTPLSWDMIEGGVP